MAAEYTDTQRMAFLRHMIVAEGYLPVEVARVRDDARATDAEFNAAMDAAMKRCGWVPIDGVTGAQAGDVAEALRGLRNLKVLLGADAPEVRGWAPAVQQAAQKAVNTAISVLKSADGVPGTAEQTREGDSQP